MGLKGIKYVARVATFLPLIPVVVLLVLFAVTAGGLGKFTPADAIAVSTHSDVPGALDTFLIVAAIVSYIVGFFATAGAAGVDIAMGNRDEKDVQKGGLTGIGLATLFAGGLAVLIVAGAIGLGKVPAEAAGSAKIAMSRLNPVDLMPTLLGESTASVILILLAISSFPGACFSAFIAVNSFKTTMPKVNPYLSVGIGTLVSITLAVTHVAGKVDWVFGMIGASFGPICGAMVADYLLSGRKWPGPRAGFNLPGWISWFFGFIVGADLLPLVFPGLAGKIPALPVVAFIIGFVLYVVLAKAGLESRKLDMPPGARADA
jgi:cytosine permease